MIAELTKFIEPLKRRVLMMLARAVVKTINDSNGTQVMQLDIYEGETRDRVFRLQDYGLTSHPPKNSEALVCFLGGNRSMGFLLKVDSPEDRKKNLSEGEVALYSKFDSYLHLKANGDAVLNATKIKFQGASDELLSLMEDFIQEEIDLADKLSTDTTNTLLGPMQLNGFEFYEARKEALEEIKDKLTAIKAT